MGCGNAAIPSPVKAIDGGNVLLDRNDLPGLERHLRGGGVRPGRYLARPPPRDRLFGAQCGPVPLAKGNQCCTDLSQAPSCCGDTALASGSTCCVDGTRERAVRHHRLGLWAFLLQRRNAGLLPAAGIPPSPSRPPAAPTGPRERAAAEALPSCQGTSAARWNAGPQLPLEPLGGHLVGAGPRQLHEPLRLWADLRDLDAVTATSALFTPPSCRRFLMARSVLWRRRTSPGGTIQLQLFPVGIPPYISMLQPAACMYGTLTLQSR